MLIADKKYLVDWTLLNLQKEKKSEGSKETLIHEKLQGSEQ